MKSLFFIAIISIMKISLSEIILKTNFTVPLTSIAQQLSKNVYSIHYSMTTQQGYNMDCLKVIYTQNLTNLAVFHSGKFYSDSYNRLYAAARTNQNNNFIILNKLSDRGSQGTIFSLGSSGSYLVAYELENHQHGNTFALRYYQSIEHLKNNNFLYEYQLQQLIDNKKVKNVGTPSIQSIQLVKNQSQFRFNDYLLKVKFHYSPDGSHDYPGYGYINLKPLRDFVDKNGQWVGGCKQNYSDWKGSSDQNVQNAMLKIGVTGKIGQRDSFVIQNSGKSFRYYLYEANLNSDFNWKNWRIFLYGQNQNQVIPIPFVFDKVYDLANPHITIETKNESQIVLQMSLFLPSQGMQPLSDATPGEVMVKTKLAL